MTKTFDSFFFGGFECATHRRADGFQVDAALSSGHTAHAEEDYSLLQRAGMRTVRDGLRWHCIETAPDRYDWSTFLPMLDAALCTGTQVIWDICHWGIPAGLDIFSEEFVERFTAFASAAATLIFEHSGGLSGPAPFYCPINEISFWAWIGGDVQAFAPYRQGEGAALKRQFVRATLSAMRAVRAVDPRARFVQAEPIIHIAQSLEEGAGIPGEDEVVRGHNFAQFEAWDMLRGDVAPELGGSPEMLDLIGANYYWNNQWIHGGERTPLGHRLHRPLHHLLQELGRRYQRPILVSETGAEAGSATGWLGYVSAEVRCAMRSGVDVTGLCIYPVMDYPGWDDDRHCPCGLIAVDAAWKQRTLRADFAEELAAQSRLFPADCHLHPHIGATLANLG